MFIDHLHDSPKLINRPYINIKNKITNGATIRISNKDLENNINLNVNSIHNNDIIYIMDK